MGNPSATTVSDLTVRQAGTGDTVSAAPRLVATRDGSTFAAAATVAAAGQKRPIGVILAPVGVASRPRRFRLRGGRCVVGAGDGADLVIADPSVSRRHLEVEVVAQGVSVRDLDSRNGTFFHGQRVKHLVLAPGSVLHLGKCQLRFELDEDMLQEVAAEPAAAAATCSGYGELVGATPVMRSLFARLARLEGSLVDVLVEGESGTGKELAVRAIHQRSQVAGGPLVAVDCGGLQRELVESELFGHRQGAFPGASEHRRGAFEEADGGTLFLDDVAELPRELQAVLLRVLQDRSVTRVGETHVRPINVRVVAATNRNLWEEVQAGRFSEDLYRRLSVVSIVVPPLRDRLADVPLLVEHFARRFGAPELGAAIATELAGRPWPGNVRELSVVVQVFLSIGVMPPEAPFDPARVEAVLAQHLDLERPYDELRAELLQQFQRTYVRALLARVGGDVAEAARQSGMERSYLTKLAHNLSGLR
jgi:two-component system, NtrC family, response regulator GlrR